MSPNIKNTNKQLSVGEILRQLTVNGVPQEDGASFEATTNLVNPLIVKSHPGRTVLASEVAWLRTVPEIRGIQVLPCLRGAPGEATLHCLSPNAHRRSKHRASGRRADVLVATHVKDDWAEQEHDGGERERKPITDELLRIGHADLADQRTDVDEQIKVLFGGSR